MMARGHVYAWVSPPVTKNNWNIVGLVMARGHLYA